MQARAKSKARRAGWQHLADGFNERPPDKVNHAPDVVGICALHALLSCQVGRAQQVWYTLHCRLPYLLLEVELQQWQHDACHLQDIHWMV